MRVTKNKLKVECVLLKTFITNAAKQANTISLLPHRYGALSSGLQTSNGATAPRTPSKKGSATPRAPTTPSSRKRANKSPQKSVGDVESDDPEDQPAVKRAKAEIPASNGTKRKEVKSEPAPEDGQLAEEELNFFSV